MNLRTLMQAGPIKANDLFAKLSDTSDGAVKTREKLFAELKGELELHTGLEEQHLFPVLRRNTETKDLVVEAIKDNKALRAKLAELDALPKNDEAFPVGLKELQKTFRQHARDDKRELLPAVQRALSEDQVQSVTEKIEAGVAEAEQARHEEAAQNLARVRYEREEAERHAEQEAAAQRAKDEAERSAHEAADAMARTATAAQTNVLHFAQTAASNAQRIGGEMQSAADSYIATVKTMVPDFRTVTALPKAAVGAMIDIQSAWIEWMDHTTRARAQMSQTLLRQAVDQQRQFAAEAVHGWMEYNTRVMQTTLRVAQQTFRPLASHSVGERGSRQ
jgi:hypothetical protein